MQTYVIKRVLLFFPTVILLTGVVFVILRLVPGDPALVFLSGVRGDQEYTQDDLARLRAELGTDRPIYVQYGSWVWNMLRGDFGESFTYKTPVADDLRRTFPITLELTLLASIVANVVAIPLGMISALKRDTLADYATRIITITGIAVPNFWVAILLIFFLVLIFNWIAPIAYVELWEDPLTNLQQMAFPAACLAFSNMAFVARVTRSAMLEVYREDYIRTARAKGLAEMVVISRHALKNALLPVITVSGYEFGRLLGGTIIIENIFLIPGIGRLLITALTQRDYAVIQSVVILVILLVLVLNMVLDIMYAWLNPRIRYT